MLGGLSGVGGPGGDAGNVTLVYLKQSPQNAGVSPQSFEHPSNEISSAINVKGGEPGDSNE